MEAWLIKNIRFCIYLASLGLALGLFLYVRQAVPIFSLRLIRLDEYYALAGLAFLYVTLLVSPLYTIFPNLPGRGPAFTALRALGLSAFFFALLHANVSFFGLLRGFHGLRFLNAGYLAAELIGLLALLVLAAMAVTSNDWAMRRLGKYWQRLHRTVYLVGLLVIIHTAALGNHFFRPNSVLPQIIYLASVLLIILQAGRIYKKQRLTKPVEARYAALALVLFAAFLYYFGSSGHISHYLGSHH